MLTTTANKDVGSFSRIYASVRNTLVADCMLDYRVNQVILKVFFASSFLVISESYVKYKS